MSILPFVSLLNMAQAAPPTSGQEQDEFAAFENDIKSAPAAPAAAKKPVEKPKEKAPEPINETPEQKIERLKTEIRKNPRNRTDRSTCRNVLSAKRIR